MNFTARLRILTVLFLLPCGWLIWSSAAPAADYPPEVQRRIAAAESNLLGVVRIKGRPAGTITRRMRELRVPGLSVAVINNYQLEWAKGYGLADAATGSPVTAATIFQAASVSKPITALAALQLVEAGQLDLDRDVNAQLKSWKVPENEFTRQHAVDLRGNLSHTAGTTVHGFPGYKVGEPLPTVVQILDGIKPANTPAVRVDKVPGRGFRYSGGGTTIVQQLLIDVTGQPFGELLQERVLAPLAMNSSRYQQPPDKQLWDVAASAHDPSGKPIEGRWHIYPELAPAGLWTTAADVARYVIEVQLAHEGKSAKVLKKQASVDAMLTRQGGGPVGLGPFLPDDGPRRFEHGGHNEGFSCQFVGLLDCGQGAVVMTNSQVGGPLVNEVINAIALAYDWPDFLPPERELPAIDAKLLARYVGGYEVPSRGVATVAQNGKQLLLKTSQGLELELFFESPTAFITPEPSLKGQFTVDDDGQVKELVLDAGGRELRAKRKP